MPGIRSAAQVRPDEAFAHTQRPDAASSVAAVVALQPEGLIGPSPPSDEAGAVRTRH